MSFIAGEIKMEDDITEVSTKIPIVEARRIIRPRKIRRGGDKRKSRRDLAEEKTDDDEEEVIDDDEEDKGEGEDMAVDKPEHVFSKRTMRDQFG